MRYKGTGLPTWSSSAISSSRPVGVMPMPPATTTTCPSQLSPMRTVLIQYSPNYMGTWMQARFESFLLRRWERMGGRVTVL